MSKKNLTLDETYKVIEHLQEENRLLNQRITLLQNMIEQSQNDYKNAERKQQEQTAQTCVMHHHLKKVKKHNSELNKMYAEPCKKIKEAQSNAGKKGAKTLLHARHALLLHHRPHLGVVGDLLRKPAALLEDLGHHSLHVEVNERSLARRVVQSLLVRR